MNKKPIVIICLLIAAIYCHAINIISPVHENIKYIGRVSVKKNPDRAKFSFPGVQIRTVFEGTSLKLLMKPSSGYYMVELDNRKPYKIHTNDIDSVTVVATELPKGKHKLTLTMVTEGYKYRPIFYGFILDDGCTLPEAPKLPKRKIEFIGNSITCGYGVESNNPKERFSFATENQFLAYDGITARNLDAQCWVVACSGMGVYRNCGGKVTGDKCPFPAQYPYVLNGGYGEKWDFSRFTPDVVCINLGTNDFSFDKCDTIRFVKAYHEFLHAIRANYHDAPIVILSGTMMRLGSKSEVILRRLLDRVCTDENNNGDKNIFRFDMTPEDGSMGYAADYHPSMQRQQFMATELTAYLRKLMNW